MGRTATYDSENLNFDKVWMMFQETKEILSKSSLETDKKFQETKEILSKSSLEVDRKFSESDRKFQETKELLAKSSLETDHKFQETKEFLEKNYIEGEKRMRETERVLNNLMKKMSQTESRWGKFVETLVEGALINLLKGRNIYIERTALREKGRYQDRQYEIDIIGKNGHDLVVVEVKTTLDEGDVKRFIEKLKIFKQVFTDYSDKRIIGAVGYINTEGDSDTFAMKKGLYVIKATGESATITNPTNFEPKEW